MESFYRRLYLVLLTDAGEVCPNAESETIKPSEWAREKFEFEASKTQAEVLDSDAKYLILCCNRQWGKTTTIGLKALHHAITKPRQSVVVISRTKDQAGLLLEIITDCAIQLGYPVRRVLGQRFSFKFPNGSRICAVPHCEDTSVGRTANVLIVDEAARVKDKVFFTVSAFVARAHGAIWILSTPKRQAGFFYNFWHDKDPRWRRIFSNVHDCPDIDPDFLDLQKKADPTSYRQDFECEFVQSDEFLTNRQFVEQMLYSEDEKHRLPKW